MTYGGASGNAQAQDTINIWDTDAENAPAWQLRQTTNMSSTKKPLFSTLLC